MRIVVVGGGYAGMAASARLAKLGHSVSLFEARDRLGGAVGFVEADGFRWDAGPSYTLLPAVMRDLFRKSGRPLERELTLEPVATARQHRFPDGTVLDLPTGSRGDQIRAVDDALGAGTGQAWGDYTQHHVATWEALRRDWLERPYEEALASPEARALLSSRESLYRDLRRRFRRDERLRLLAAHPFVAEGHDPRNVPAWAGMTAYVEQNFGTWTVPGGMGTVAEVLASRLETRGVVASTGTPVLDLETAAGRVTGVRLAHGVEPADAVVVACDPRRLPALAPYVVKTMPALPPVVVHLGIEGTVPSVPYEVVLHGDPLLVLRTGGQAPAGAHAWTLHGRGKLAEDMVSVLDRHGLRLREQIVTRVDRSPRELVEDWHGSPYGVLWQGRRTLAHRLGNRTPVDGVYCAGAHTTPGAGLPYAGLSAALVAQIVGPA